MAAQQVKPKISQPQAVELVKRLFRLTPSEIRSLPSYDDQNFFVAVAGEGEYVLKITNSKDSKNSNMVEVQTYAMTFLHQHGLPVQSVIPTISGQLMSLEEMDCGYGSQKYLVRLLTYLPGITISKAPLTPQLMYEAGKTAARMDQILQKMVHPHLNALQRENFLWSLSSTPLLERYVHVLDEEPLQEIVKSVIRINHGDLNDLNVLVQPDGSDGYRISGIIDFGDMYSGYYVHELAMVITCMMIEHPYPIEAGGPVLAGWESVLPLNEAEKDCLYVLLLCRFCQLLVLVRHFLTLYPDNVEYLMIIPKKVIHILPQMWELGKEHVEKVWFQSAAQFRGQD
ncbi:hydroxylysine kinase-like [Xyrichtys novacula]|uniref:Hydroxylysine kinase n=1 Tax=Xyrichtys novacula TaxID=13765 RepID=A0AAV1FH73_XYRNO|nr:hydroxylysine kinase-like [Xyrichtys novacula]